MSHQNTLRKSMLALAVAAAIGPATAVADGDDVQALQDRVAQLEAMVRELVADRAETRGEIRRIEAEAEAAVDRKVAAAVEEMKPDDDDPSHSYKFGGYIKSDFIMSRYSDGDLPPGNLGRDFYIPGLTPVGGADESTHADFHARESRIYFRSDHVLDNGFKIGTYLEMDFLVTENGNERISNSYSPRMRHAFIKTDKWLAGQTWSTFQNVGALAENIDFVGPAEGTVFERQAMVRYTTGAWQFALENPETTLTPNGGGGRIVTDDGAFPDLVARYEMKGDWGNLVFAGLYRSLDFEDPASGIDADEASYGLSVSGKHPVGAKDDFRWMLSGGTGLGRYLGLNTANGGVLTANGDIEAIDSFAGFASYRHFWNPQWRSNLTLSFIDVDNDTNLTGTSVTKDTQSVHVNLIYSPLPKFDFGVEYIYATREVESGLDGDMNRLQFAAKYTF